MQAIVVGAGIGGLAAGIALKQAGIDVSVFEQAENLSHSPTGVTLAPNAVSALAKLGVDRAVRAKGTPIAATLLRDWQGKVLRENSYAELSRRHGVVTTGIHRADLLTVLAEELGTENVHFSHKCTSVHEDEYGAFAWFRNGQFARGDVIIGADGIWSILRDKLFRDASARYAGFTSWRGVVRIPGKAVTSGESWGKGCRFRIGHIGNDTFYWYASAIAREGPHISKDEIKPKLLDLFSLWHEPICDLIDATDESVIIQSNIYDRAHLPKWSKGRMTLLGESAHPITPNLGQGTAQAIEDAIALAECLKDVSQDKIPAALRAYEQKRKEQAYAICRRSHRMGAISGWKNPLLCGLRNTAIRLTPPSVLHVFETPSDHELIPKAGA